VPSRGMKVIKYLPKVKLAESYKLHNLGPEAMQYLASSKLTIYSRGLFL
jgi:hypothetical protein